MPPRPLFHGSRPARAKAAATTASTADPPAANISAPTVAATPFWEATTPPREAATGFRTTQFCINAAISDHLDRIDAALVEGVMPGEARRLVIGRPIGPDGVLRAFRAAIDFDRPIGAIPLERAIGLVIRRLHQVEPHLLPRNVLPRLMACLFTAHGLGRVGDRLTGEGDAHAPRFGQQVDAVLGFFQIAGGGVCHGCAPRFSESSRMAAAGSSGAPVLPRIGMWRRGYRKTASPEVARIPARCASRGTRGSARGASRRAGRGTSLKSS